MCGSSALCTMQRNRSQQTDVKYHLDLHYGFYKSWNIIQTHNKQNLEKKLQICSNNYNFILIWLQLDSHSPSVSLIFFLSFFPLFFSFYYLFIHFIFLPVFTFIFHNFYALIYVLLYFSLLPSLFIRFYISFFVLSLHLFINPSFPFVYLLVRAHFPSLLPSFIVFLAFTYFYFFHSSFLCLYFISSLPFIFLPW